MAMKINQNRTFKAPVTVSYYDNAGNLVSGGFTATFKTLTSTRNSPSRPLQRIRKRLGGDVSV